ncbi:xanthine dehydrogenase family protein molybdopterin-binding subunit [Marinivivus vitaminiproducens]|uniref:xanthine dehydrogenase family protein molybdopterin-binding subunit n=1 Tax=Marinivivus vitaminiproducens TaxID=3035935 RepID=UPI0027A14A5D|nr:xanthine dehydrogenase family protein molybdopterin-binding subunit [Geminicoccaceae bacterium SCSIO 64248]
MSITPFPDIARVDALDKVQGRTIYAADVPLAGLLHAMTVPATINKGTLTSIDVEAALAVPGVVRVLTHNDTPPPPSGPQGSPPLPPMLVPAIAYRGQPIALVVAETLEAAIEGAEAVRATYATEPFAVRIEDADTPREDTESPTFGDADAAFANAATTIEAVYTTTANHHNPMELLSTTAVWSGGRLTIYEGTQTSSGLRNTVAQLVQVDRASVDVISPQVGGGFGQRGEVPRHTAVVAQAARLIGRPVKLVMPRHQIFHNSRFRPHVQHTIRLAADADGIMVAARYDCLQQNSRRGRYRADWYHAGPSKIYGIANYRGTSGDLRLDTHGPAHMRAPYEHPSSFAFESAVDELAYALGRDPVELRLSNDTKIDPSTGNRLTSRFLNACLTRGAERFGWSERRFEPGSMTGPDGMLIGWGVGAGVYQAAMHPAIATLRVGADGSTRYASAGHEMGQGMRTAIAQVLLAGLRIDPTRLTILIGDTTAAPQHSTAGSWGTASSVPVAAAAAERMTAALNRLLDGRDVPGNMHEQLARVRRPYLEVEVSMAAPGQGAEHVERMRSGGNAIAGLHGAYSDFTALSYIAHFVEVRIEPHTRRIRVPRVVSVADCGRVVSPRTARSQVQGGVVWALGAALRETSEVDPRYGGWLNADIAEYHVSVNADIGEIDVSFIDEPDFDANAAGVKGVGEIAMVGAAAALANAVFHATGRRLRTLPVRVDHLL